MYKQIFKIYVCISKSFLNLLLFWKRRRWSKRFPVSEKKRCQHFYVELLFPVLWSMHISMSYWHEYIYTQNHTVQGWNVEDKSYYIVKDVTHLLYTPTTYLKLRLWFCHDAVIFWQYADTVLLGMLQSLNVKPPKNVYNKNQAFLKIAKSIKFYSKNISKRLRDFTVI